MKTSVGVSAVFDQVTVLSREGSTSDGRALWKCQCSCGEGLLATSKQLTRKYVRACKDCQDSGSKSPLATRLRKYEVAADGCWNWTGKQNEHGYGAITVDGKYTRAHRAVYFMLHPDANKALVVMHKCDNPRCVNPEHLQLGTVKENIMDMHSKGRFKGGAKLGNQNAKGNKGWMKGGVTSKYASKFGDEIEIPEGLK